MNSSMGYQASVFQSFYCGKDRVKRKYVWKDQTNLICHPKHTRILKVQLGIYILVFKFGQHLAISLEMSNISFTTSKKNIHITISACTLLIHIKSKQCSKTEI